MLIERTSKLWKYLDPEMKGLISDGEALLYDVKLHNLQISDYSYLVFPFSKAYEGFLKKLFLNLGLINKAQFYGDEIRIGRILNPVFKHEKASIFQRMSRHSGGSYLTEKLWFVWKNGRNLVFHYYPHNFRRLSLNEAETLVKDIVSAMQEAVSLV